MKFYPLMAVCLSLFSCHLPTKLPEDKMKVIVWNLMKDSYDSTTSTFKFTGKFTDEDLAPLEEVFKKNNVSREDFYYTFESYQQDPTSMKTLMDSVVAYGNRDYIKPALFHPAAAAPLKTSPRFPLKPILRDPINPALRFPAKPRVKSPLE